LRILYESAKLTRRWFCKTQASADFHRAARINASFGHVLASRRSVATIDAIDIDRPTFTRPGEGLQRPVEDNCGVRLDLCHTPHK
jgi:hypothetical protein